MGHDIGGAVFRKSSYSGSNGGGCVEIASNLPGVIAIRDSKDPGGPALLFSPDEWKAFLAGITGGKISL